MMILFYPVILFLLLVALAKYNKPADDLVQAISKEWIKARTVFTALFYMSFIYLILKKITIPQELNTIVSTLFGYWFGQRQSAQKKEGEVK